MFSKVARQAMKAELHPQEDARLDALRDYEVLDTDPEAVFDDIVKLASAICDMPMSIISLLDWAYGPLVGSG